jgi:hypothetical protein
MNKLFKYFIYALLFSPLIGYVGYVYSGFQAIQLLEYAVLGLFTVFIISRDKPIKVPRFLYFYFCYIIYIYIWRLYNGTIEEKGLTKYIFNNFHLYTALLITIIYNLTIDEYSFNKSLIIIKIVLVIALFGALVQLLFDPDFFIRPRGWIAGTDDVSIYLLRRPSVFTYVSDNEYGISILAYFSLIIALFSMKKKHTQVILFSIIVGLYSILTNTRYVMIGFAIVVFQLFLKQRLSKMIKYLISLLIVLFSAYYIYTYVLGFNLGKLASERLFAEGDIKHTSRYLAYELYLKYFPENPFFGASPNLAIEIKKAANEAGSSQVHVGYLAHLVSFGLVGSFFLFTFWGLLAHDLYTKAKCTGFYGAFFAFLVFLWANATLVEYNIFYPGVIIALVYSEYYYAKFLQTRFKISIHSGLTNQKNSVPRYL